MFRSHFEKAVDAWCEEQDEAEITIKQQMKYLMEGINDSTRNSIKFLRMSSLELARILFTGEAVKTLQLDETLQKVFFETIGLMIDSTDDDILFCCALSIFRLFSESPQMLWLNKPQVVFLLKLLQLEKPQCQPQSIATPLHRSNSEGSASSVSDCTPRRLKRRFHASPGSRDSSPLCSSVPGASIVKARELIEIDTVVKLGVVEADQVTTRILALAVLQQLCNEMDDYIRAHSLGGTLPDDHDLKSATDQADRMNDGKTPEKSVPSLTLLDTPDKTLRQVKKARGKLAPSRMLLHSSDSDLSSGLSLESDLVQKSESSESKDISVVFDPERVRLKEIILEKGGLDSLSLMMIYGARDIQKMDAAMKRSQVKDRAGTPLAGRLAVVLAQLNPVLHCVEACLYRSKASQRRLTLENRRQGCNLLKALLATVHALTGWITPELSQVRKEMQSSEQPTQSTVDGLFQAQLDLCAETWGFKVSESIKAQALESLLSSLRVLVNLTHHNMDAAATVGVVGGLKVLMGCFIAHGVDGDTKETGNELLKHMFDAQLLVLNVLTNCSEINAENRDRIAKMHVFRGKQNPQSQSITFPEFLARFLKKKMKQFKAILKAQSSKSKLPKQPEPRSKDEEDDAMTSREADDLILSSYMALLLCCLMRDHESNHRLISSTLKDCSPDILVRCLKAFLVLQKQAGILTREVAIPVFAMINEMSADQQKLLKKGMGCSESMSSTVQKFNLKALQSPENSPNPDPKCRLIMKLDDASSMQSVGSLPNSNLTLADSRNDKGLTTDVNMENLKPSANSTSESLQSGVETPNGDISSSPSKQCEFDFVESQEEESAAPLFDVSTHVEVGSSQSDDLDTESSQSQSTEILFETMDSSSQDPTGSDGRHKDSGQVFDFESPPGGLSVKSNTKISAGPSHGSYRFAPISKSTNSEDIKSVDGGKIKVEKACLKKVVMQNSKSHAVLMKGKQTNENLKGSASVTTDSDQVFDFESPPDTTNSHQGAFYVMPNRKATAGPSDEFTQTLPLSNQTSSEDIRDVGGGKSKVGKTCLGREAVQNSKCHAVLIKGKQSGETSKGSASITTGREEKQKYNYTKNTSKKSKHQLSVKAERPSSLKRSRSKLTGCDDSKPSLTQMKRSNSLPNPIQRSTKGSQFDFADNEGSRGKSYKGTRLPGKEPPTRGAKRINSHLAGHSAVDVALNATAAESDKKRIIKKPGKSKDGEQQSTTNGKFKQKKNTFVKQKFQKKDGTASWEVTENTSKRRRVANKKVVSGESSVISDTNKRSQGAKSHDLISKTIDKAKGLSSQFDFFED